MTAREHNRTLGILFLVYSGLQIFGLVVAVVAMIILGGTALSAENDAASAALIFGVMAVVLISVLILIVPIVVGGWKMFKELPNARNWAIAASIISCLNAPLGTALGVYGLWFLYSEEGKRFHLNPSERDMIAPPPNSWQ